MGKIAAVTSGKGGVGKSTFSVCVASSLVSLGKKVLLIDMDCGLRCLDIMLNVSEKIVFDLSDVTSKKVSLSDAAVSTDSGVHLLAAPYSPEMPESDALTLLAEDASSIYDFVIFDFPAGIDVECYKALGRECMFITVSTPDKICIRDAFAISRNLSDFAPNRRLVINRFLPDYVKAGFHSGIDDMIDQSATRLLGVVPEDFEIPFKLTSGKLPKSKKTLCAFKRIAKRMCGENVPLVKIKKL